MEHVLHWSLAEVCVKELRPMCLSLSCHVERDLGSKGRKVRVYLLKATSPLLQKNKQRRQTHCYKASHRGHRPKLRQRFFFSYTYVLKVHVSGPTWHGSFRFINSGCWNLYNHEAKQAFPKCCINVACSSSRKEVLWDLIQFLFLVYYFLTSLPRLFTKATYRWWIFVHKEITN